MPNKDNYWVSKRDDGWAQKHEGRTVPQRFICPSAKQQMPPGMPPDALAANFS